MCTNQMLDICCPFLSAADLIAVFEIVGYAMAVSQQLMYTTVTAADLVFSAPRARCWLQVGYICHPVQNSGSDCATSWTAE